MLKAVESASRWLLEKYNGKNPVPLNLVLSLCKRQAAWASARGENLDIEEMARLVAQNVAAKGLNVEGMPASNNSQKTTAQSLDASFTFARDKDTAALFSWMASILHSKTQEGSVLFSAKFL